MDILKAEIERKRKHLEEKDLVGVSNDGESTNLSVL